MAFGFANFIDKSSLFIQRGCYLIHCSMFGVECWKSVNKQAPTNFFHSPFHVDMAYQFDVIKFETLIDSVELCRNSSTFR